VAKFVLIKTAPDDTYINPDHVVCIEAVGTGCRITMIDGRDFTTSDDKEVSRSTSRSSVRCPMHNSASFFR
jgi:hypothetical protein